MFLLYGNWKQEKKRIPGQGGGKDPSGHGPSRTGSDPSSHLHTGELPTIDHDTHNILIGRYLLN